MARLTFLLASTCLVGALAAPAWADPAGAQADNVAGQNAGTTTDAAQSGNNEVIVTGTRIVRLNNRSAAPIQTVTAQDIKAQSPINIEEVLNRLPQVAPDSQQNYQDSDGRQRIKLRNLGFERTLVLVDGKRLGTQNGEDANMIPVSLLQRVDVLTGGASSVYGSDAIAGVVNFILKPDFTGIQLDGNYNFYLHHNTSNIVTDQAQADSFKIPHGTTIDGPRIDATLTAGTKLFDGRLGLSGFVNYRQATLLRYSDRSTSACQLLQTGKDGPLSCSLSTYSLSGYILPRSGPNSGTPFLNNPNGTRTFVPYGVGPGMAANPLDDYPAQRADKRVNAGGFAHFDISPAAQIYSSALWFRDRSSNPYPRRVFAAANYGSDPYQVNCNNPFLSGSQATALCGSAAGTSTLAPIDIRYRFSDGVPPLSDYYTNRGLRLTGGVRGKFGGAWSYDVGGVFARNQQTWWSGSLPNFDRINRALNVVNVNGVPTCASVVNGTDSACVPFDAFRAGNHDQKLVDYIYENAVGIQKITATLYDALASVSGDLRQYGIKSPFAEDGVAVALGAEYREDRFASVADAQFRSDYGGEDLHLSQRVKEANIELQAPLVQDKPFAHLLQANGGFRLSKYNTNPNRFTTWKLEGMYAPVEDLTFRASFNKAQRAPTVIETMQATRIGFSKQGGSQNDFCAPVPRQIPDPNDPTKTITTTVPLASQAVCRATGLPDSLYGSPTLLCPNSQCTVRSGGFTADPETAYTQTYGLVLKPRFLKGLILSVDRYRIKINNSLGYNDDSYYTDGCLRSNGDPFFCQGIVRDANGTLYASASSNPTSGFIRAGTTNYYYSIARGWDFQANYTLPLGNAGRIDAEFNGSLTTFAGGQDSPIQPKRNCTGYYGNGCGQLIPKWSHGLRTTYSTANNKFNASFNWRYVGSLTNANNSGDPAIGGTPDRAQTTFYRIAPMNYFDLALTLNVDQHLTMRLVANNLFDKNPPILPNSYDISLARNNTIPQRYDSLGRNIVLGATLRF